MQFLVKQMNALECMTKLHVLHVFLLFHLFSPSNSPVWAYSLISCPLYPALVVHPTQHLQQISSQGVNPFSHASTDVSGHHS